MSLVVDIEDVVDFFVVGKLVITIVGVRVMDDIIIIMKICIFVIVDVTAMMNRFVQSFSICFLQLVVAFMDEAEVPQCFAYFRGRCVRTQQICNSLIP